MIEFASLENWSKIIFTNEDYYFSAFLKAFFEKDQFAQGPASFRCKKSPVSATTTNRFKKCELDYSPLEGLYKVSWNGNEIYLNYHINPQCVLTTQCRQIDFVKTLTIYAQDIKVGKQYVESILIEISEPTDKIVIYENNSGYWNVSKQKKPRSLESVVLKKELIDSVLEDVQDFIDSENWYTEMGIPYKRSYLLFGPPGTGKSSFAQALAGHIGYSICFVNCSDNICDFQFNGLLNTAPKKSIILIQDVDAIFSERKNTQKNNTLTFSGFLNALDGVRSQQGRLMIMTTNYKERLDPALLRPGRVDQMFEISYASKFQLQGICYRFFKNEEIAKKFSELIPEFKFSMSMIQGYLLKYRKNPENILKCINEILESDQNVKIQKFLEEINCLEVLNDFKIEECYSLSAARNLPRQTLNQMASKLNPLKKGRIIETVRLDRSLYIKQKDELEAFVDQNYKCEQIQRQLKEYLRQNANVKTFFQIRDKHREIEESEQKQKNACVLTVNKAE